MKLNLPAYTLDEAPEWLRGLVEKIAPGRFTDYLAWLPNIGSLSIIIGRRRVIWPGQTDPKVTGYPNFFFYATNDNPIDDPYVIVGKVEVRDQPLHYYCSGYMKSGLMFASDQEANNHQATLQAEEAATAPHPVVSTIERLSNLDPVCPDHRRGATTEIIMKAHGSYEIGQKYVHPRKQQIQGVVDAFVQPCWEYDGVWLRLRLPTDPPDELLARWRKEEFGKNFDKLRHYENKPRYIKIAHLDLPGLELNPIGMCLKEGEFRATLSPEIRLFSM